MRDCLTMILSFWSVCVVLAYIKDDALNCHERWLVWGVACKSNEISLVLGLAMHAALACCFRALETPYHRIVPARRKL